MEPALAQYINNKFFTFGRMISGDKRCPDGEKCVFNANICTRKLGKIWYGDLNLTHDGEKLKELAQHAGETIYVLPEHAARFETEANPQFDSAVQEYTP